MNPEAMMSTEVEITLKEKLAEIDASIDAYHEQIRVGEAIKRLEANEDYITVVSHGYLEAEAERLMSLIVGDDPLRRESMENIIEAGLAIRNYKQYLRYKKLDAVQAVQNIEENLNYRKHITENYAEDGTIIDAEEV
jgi:hypothetical protein